MAWKLKPINTRDVQAYDFVRQFYHRFCELNCAVNGDFLWPAGNKRYYNDGRITGVTLDDSDPNPANWTIAFNCTNADGTSPAWESTYPTGCSGTSRWVDLSCPSPTTPARYDMVIEGGHRTRTVTVDGDDYTYRIPDETMIVRAEITASTNNTLTVKAIPLLNAATGKIIGSLPSLVDKTFHIMRARSVGQSLHPMERWIQWPNGYPTQQQIKDGTGSRTFNLNGQSVTAIGRMVLWSGTVESGDDHSLVDDSDDLTGKHAVGFDPNKAQTWSTDRWKNQEVLVYDTVGLLHREKLTRGNDRKTLLWGAVPLPGQLSTWTPTGKYLIVEPDCRGLPDREPEAAKYWYSGYTQPVYGHYPNDVVADLPWPIDTIIYSEGATIFDCEPQSHDALDVDIHTTDDDVCAEQGPDFYSAPDLYKSRRALQLAARAFIPQFVDPDSVGVGKAGRSKWTLATAFRKRGINSTIATITAVGGGTVTHSGVTLPKPTHGSPTPTSLPCFWAVIDHDRVTYKGAADGVITATTIGNTDIDSDDIGKTLVICWGESSYYPREVFRLYGQTVAIPAWDSSPGGHGLVDPPRTFILGVDGCFGTQQYIHRSKSTTYLERNFLGFAQEGGQTFIKDELARYVGSDWATPDIGLSQPGTELVIQDEPDEKRTYWDHFTIGQHWSTGKQRVIQAAMSGVVSDGGNNFLTDNAKNWYRSVWYTIAADVMRVESGVATQAGTTASLFCSTKTDNTSQEPHCWWDPDRFVGFTYAYEGFPIRIKRGGVEWRTYITSTSQSGSGTTINFRAIPVPIQAGDEFYIDEPYEVNRWQERIVKVTKKSNGQIYNAIVTHSDIDTLFFDALPGGVLVEPGDFWELIEIPTGSVLRWLDEGGVTGWVRPIVGAIDPRKGTANAAGINGGIYKESPWNLPTTVRTYRAAMLGDYSGVQWSEIYEVINLLKLRDTTGGWGARGEANADSWPGDDLLMQKPGATHNDCGQDCVPCGSSTSFDQANCNWAQAWNNCTDSYDGGLTNDDPPSMGTSACKVAGGQAGGEICDGCNWTVSAAEIEKHYSYYDGQVTNFCQKIPLQVALYVLGKKPCATTTCTTCVFDNGGAPIADGTWTNWDNEFTDEDGFWTSAKFGTGGAGNKPSPPPEPADPGGSCTFSRCYTAGYLVDDAFVLIDYSPFMELLDF